MPSRPWDGADWTAADLADLQVRFAAPPSHSALRVYRVYVVVEYQSFTEDGVLPITPANAPRRFDDRTRDNTPTLVGGVHPSWTRVELYAGGSLIGTDEDVSDGTWSVSSTPLADGAHQITARAFTGAVASVLGPPLAVTIDTVSPASPSQPDLVALSDSGRFDDDDITDDRQPVFVGTSAADVVVVGLLDDGRRVASDNAVTGGSWTAPVAVAHLAPGQRAFTAVAYDDVGNASTPGGQLAVEITGHLRVLRGIELPPASVGEVVYIVATTHDETGVPVADYAGTVTVTAPSSAAAVFPDGASATLSGADGTTGHAFRVVLGAPGAHTLRVTGPGLVDATYTVAVTDTSLSASAPATAYVGVPVALEVGPRDADGLPLANYNGVLAFGSSDTGATYSGGIDANRQYRLTCRCEGDRSFPVTFATTGIQTVTVTDQFGNSDQVTVNVLSAPAALPIPAGLEAYAVQWSNGHTVDYYVRNTSGVSLTAVEAVTSCTSPGDPHHTSIWRPLGARESFSTTIPSVRCWVGGSGEYGIHALIVVDTEGHKWVLPAPRHLRLDEIPSASSYEALDEGDPLGASSLTVVSRSFSPVSQALEPGSSDGYFNVVRDGLTVTITASDRIQLIGYSFPGQPSTTQWAPEPGEQLRLIAPGTNTYVLDYLPWACYHGPHNNDALRLQYKDFLTNRDGYREFHIGSPVSAPAGLCDSPNGGRAHGINGSDTGSSEIPMGLDWFSAPLWTRVGEQVGDPIDVFTGAQTASVRDFSLGGLTPSLSLTRSYRSDIADQLYWGKAGAHARPLLFGPGWASEYDVSLEAVDATRVSIRAADGGYYAFTKTNAGFWVASVRSRPTLTQVSGGWRLTDDDSGTGYRFDTGGRLVALFDPNGRELSLGYDGGGDLASLTDPAGRSATVTVVGDRVTRVDLPDGRYVAYGYDADGHLASVRDLAGTTLTYAVDVRGRITAVRNQAGDALLRNVTDARGRVVVQYDALSHPTFVAYDDVELNRVVVDARGATTVSCYDGRGRLTARTDALGGVIRQTYDPRGNPQRSTDELGDVTVTRWDATDRPVSVLDPAGRQTTFSYDGATNRPTGVVDPLGSTTITYTGTLPDVVTRSAGQDSQTLVTYGFDPVTRLPTSVTVPDAGTTTTHYDARGYVDYTLDAEGRKTTFATNARGYVTSIVSPEGNVSGADPDDFRTTFSHDDAGRVLTETNPLGQTTTYTYDSMGRPKTVTTPLGAVTTHTYDLAGQLRTTVETLDTGVTGTTTYDYDAVGNLISVEDAEGRVTETDYDLLGRPTAVTDEAGETWTTAYDAKGRVVGTEDPTGAATETHYNELDQVTAVVDPANLETTYAYDAATGLLDTITDPADEVTEFGYDWLGRQESVTNAKDQTASVTYDDAGRVLTVTNARGKTTAFEFDLTGRLTTVTEPGGIETVMTYDEAGYLATRTNDRGAVETYGYDPLGRPTSLLDAAGETWTTAYDADGRLDFTVDGKSQTTDFAHDLGGRLRTITPASGAPITYAYDKTARLASMTDGTGTITYGYDPVGRLASFTRAGRTTAYTYDEAGRPATVAYPASGGTVAYDYDAAGRLDTITDWAARVTDYDYDTVGRIDDITRPGGLVTDFTYDELHRPLTETHLVAGSPSATLGYTYDANGNLETFSDGSGTATFTYDDLDRLETAAYPGGQNYNYAYDAVGNLLSATTPAGTTAHTYDLADRRTSGGAVYDDNGNLTFDGTRTFAYDALGRLTGVTGPGLSASYTVDGDGNRWAETVNSVTTSFDLDLAQAHPTVLGDDTRRYLPGDPAAGYEQGGTWHSAITDQLGSPVASVSQAGVFAASGVAYDPFGAPRPGSANPSGIGYAGEWKNATGQIHLRARDYDPAQGRFGARDMFGGVLSAPQTGNRYSYALNNPYRYTDPSGRFVQSVIANPGEFASLAIGFTAIPGLAHAGLSAILGFDPLTGRTLEPWERTLGAVVLTAIPAAKVIQGIASAAARAVTRAVRATADVASSVGHRVSALASRVPKAINWTSDRAGFAGRRSTSVAADTFRRTHNAGAFSGLSVPMQLREVRRVAGDLGLEFRGVKIRIERDASLVGSKLAGHTNSRGTVVTLYPDAFGSHIDLVRTLGHERMHVYQVRTFGRATLEDLPARERAAYEIEDAFEEFWRSLGSQR